LLTFRKVMLFAVVAMIVVVGIAYAVEKDPAGYVMPMK